MDAAVLYADDRVAVSVVGRVLISVLRQPLTLDGLTVLRRESRRMMEQGTFGALSVIEPTAANQASPEMRQASAAFAKEFMPLGAAIAIEGTGFRPAATRTLIAGMYLVIKKQYPHKIVATAADAAAWLIELLGAKGPAPSVREVVAAVELARAALRSPVPA